MGERELFWAWYNCTSISGHSASVATIQVSSSGMQKKGAAGIASKRRICLNNCQGKRMRILTREMEAQMHGEAKLWSTNECWIGAGTVTRGNLCALGQAGAQGRH